MRFFAGNFVPVGWMLCEGQLLPISEYETLFQLIGTTYGGDGQQTFALPDLRGRLPLHFGGGFSLAETGGAEEITLTTAQIPAHGHPLTGASGLAADANPANGLLAEARSLTPYLDDTPAVALAPGSITSIGGSQPHDNMMPYLCVNFIISLFGIFPSPS